jgi:SAM-dependent methyltransferase
MSTTATADRPILEDTAFVRFWNEVLAPKFAHPGRWSIAAQRSNISVAAGSDGRPRPRRGLRFRRHGNQACKSGRAIGRGRWHRLLRCFLDYAHKDVEARGLTNVRFMRGDAEIALPTDQYDFVFARFGTMFFARPVAGLRNMRTALRPGGRMVHIVWRDRADNPWLSMAKDVVMRFLPEPGADALTCGPGPFSMADESTVRSMMTIAGYEKIEFRRVDAPVLVGADIADAIAFQLAIGPAGEVFREAGQEAEQKREQIEAALLDAIQRQTMSAEGIVMGSSSWVISAINPDH